jgi:hypothetical protein
MTCERLRQFVDERYISLETYRKNGQGVRTPLWFVEHEGVLYMRTPATSGKVKRIRHTPLVRVAPCDMRGNLRGEWIGGEARLIEAERAEWVNDLVKRKYGLLKRLIDLRSRLRGTVHLVIAVQV